MVELLLVTHSAAVLAVSGLRLSFCHSCQERIVCYFSTKNIVFKVFFKILYMFLLKEHLQYTDLAQRTVG